jgi:polyisoprenoid-binding protein YceI
MQKFAMPLVAAALALSACQTSSLTDSEKAPVPESTNAFSGEMKGIDKAQSRISFVGKSNIINHEGKFTNYDAVVTLDPSEPANLEKAGIQAELDAKSIEVDAAGLQGHLQKEEFFDTEKYPTITFVSKSIKRLEGNNYAITGDLTVKGVTKSVTVNAEITDAYLTAHYDLTRDDFSIGNDAYGQKLLEDTVPVDIKLVFVK